MDSSSNCSLQLNLTFYSLLDSDDGGAGLDEGEELKEEEEGQDTDPISVMQNHFQRTATSLKYKAREKRERGEGIVHICMFLLNLHAINICFSQLLKFPLLFSG